MAAPVAPQKRLFRKPFAFSAQLKTTGGGTLINGGALGAGENRDMPLEPFSNALSRPFVVKRIKYVVTRVAGGDEVDSDYDNVLHNLRDLVSNEDLTGKAPAPLSGLVDKERREWIFHPGELILRSLGGGLRLSFSVLDGAIGAPYNITATVHGYTEERAEPSAGMYPEEV